MGRIASQRGEGHALRARVVGWQTGRARCGANGKRSVSLSRSFATFVHVILFVMKTNRNTRGVLLALIGGTGWGFSGACSQYLFAQNVDPLWASAVAMAVAGAALMLYAATRRRESLRALFSNPRAVARLVLFSLVGLTLCRVTYLLATHGNPSTMALSFEGVFWGLSAAVAVAIYSLLPGSLMKEYGSVSVVACGLLLGGVVLYLGAGCWNRAPDLDIAGLLAMYGGLTGVGTLVGFAAYLTAINDIGAARASLLASVETVSATLCALLWLRTEFVAMDMIGFVLIMATVFLLAKKGDASQGKKAIQEGDKDSLEGKGSFQ